MRRLEGGQTEKQAQMQAGRLDPQPSVHANDGDETHAPTGRSA